MTPKRALVALWCVAVAACFRLPDQAPQEAATAEDAPIAPLAKDVQDSIDESPAATEAQVPPPRVSTADLPAEALERPGGSSAPAAPEPERASDHFIHRDNTFGTPEEDAFRRDFTINALFYDIATFSIIDYVDGLEDLRAGIVRSIGDPQVRFREDPVRMMRAVAFASRLGYDADVLEPARRLTEIRNWIEKLVLPFMSKRGRG